MHEEMIRDPNFQVAGYLERQKLMNKTQEEVILEDYEANIGKTNFGKLWRFFSALCPPLQPP